MSDLLAGRWETNTEDTLWREEIQRRLDDLDARLTATGRFSGNTWYPIGRFNSLYANNIMVGMTVGDESVTINENGIKIKTVTSSSPPVSEQWTYEDSTGSHRTASIFGHYGLAEDASFARLYAARYSDSPWTNAIATIDAYDATDTTNHWVGIHLHSGPEPYILSFGGAVVLPRLASDPSTDLPDGAIYYNTASNKFRGLENNVWVNVI